MHGLSILGVTHLSDLYPNVKYKIELIQQLECAEVQLCLYDLKVGNFYSGFERGRCLRQFRIAWKLLVGHARVLLSYVWTPTSHVYVAYPGLGLVLLLSMLPKKTRPVIFLDAFISLYDSIVNDRKLWPPTSWYARLLYSIERYAFARASIVLVDTDENGSFYGKLFGLSVDKFRSLPLAIPQLKQMHVRAGHTRDGSFVCLFIGSMVPLQGINLILDATRNLATIRAIKFVIIGDGQDATLVDRHLNAYPDANVIWHRGMRSTDFIIDEIGKADLCLGIFGATDKAARVLPYKLYYYAALKKPFISADTPCLRRVAGVSANLLVCSRDSNALADKIYSYYQNPSLLQECSNSSSTLYDSALSKPVLLERLLALLNESMKG